MKQTCIFMLAVMGCLFFQGHSSENTVGSPVKYETGVYECKDWDDPVGTFTGDVMPDAETALRVATIIFSNIRNASEANHEPLSVFFDEEEEVWIIFFHERDSDMLGGDRNIAIRKQDGKVLRIWSGE